MVSITRMLVALELMKVRSVTLDADELCNYPCIHSLFNAVNLLFCVIFLPYVLWSGNRWHWCQSMSELIIVVRTDLKAPPSSRNKFRLTSSKLHSSTNRDAHITDWCRVCLMKSGVWQHPLFLFATRCSVILALVRQYKRVGYSTELSSLPSPSAV